MMCVETNDQTDVQKIISIFSLLITYFMFRFKYKFNEIVQNTVTMRDVLW